MKKLYFQPFIGFWALVISAAFLNLGCSSKQGEAVSDAEDQEFSGEFGAQEGLDQESGSMEIKVSKPNVKKFTLPNGLEVFAVPKKDVPLATVLIAVRAGAFIESPEFDGLSHLYEHMFFKANERIPNQQAFMERLDELGVEMGAHANASTSTEVVRYFVTGQSNKFEELVEFMADATITPLFQQDELERERDVVLKEYSFRIDSSPTSRFSMIDMFGSTFPDYFSYKNIIGSKEIVRTATREKMMEMRNTFYVPNNAALFIAGDYPEDELQNIVEKYFGVWEAGPNPLQTNPPPQHPPLKQSVVLNEKAKLNTHSVELWLHGPSLTVDNRSVVAFQIMQSLVTNEASPFRKELIQSGLASSAGFYIWAQRYTSVLFFSLETTPDKAQAATDKLFDLIERMRRGGFFDQEYLDLVKAQTKVQQAYKNEVASNYINQMASYWSSMGSPDFYINYVDEVDAVTLADIDNAIRKYVNLDAVVAGAIGPENAPDVNFPIQAVSGAAISSPANEAVPELIPE